MMNILAIDPGCTESAYVILDEQLRPVEFGKVKNEILLEKIKYRTFGTALFSEHTTNMVIEMVASYGMAVGKEVFETVFWIGRFWEAGLPMSVQRLYRKSDVCMNLCHSTKAKDANIRQALIDRFAKHDFKNGKGTKSKPDWFHGFSNDVWSAYAVGVTYYDLHLKSP